jgi:LCP family protein required for cell wall assembly
MIVVSLDPVSGDAAMFTLPRNYARAPLPEGYGVWDCDCFPQLLNDLYYAGIQHPNAFPGPGTPSENALKGGIGHILGIEIHYYAMVTLEGFVGIVDALGGVEMTIPVTIVDDNYPHQDGVSRERVVIEAGTQTLDGHLALAYSRIRAQSSDYARMNRQRCVLEGLLDQSSPAELVVAYPRIANVLKESLQTDIPLARLPDFIDLLPKLDPDRIVALRFIPDRGYLEGFTAQNQNIYNAELIREHVQLVLTSTPDEARAALGLDSLEDACA